MTITEATTPAEMDRVFADLTAAYAAAEDTPDDVVICPLLNPIPHPTRDDFARHLDDPRVRVLVGSDGAGLVCVLLLVNDERITVGWGPVDPARWDVITWELAEWCETELGGPYLLDTGTEGWVTRMFFEDYLAQTGGPHDVTVTQPGMAPGQTYADLDDVEWTLAISRPTPADPWEWTVTVK